MIIRAITAQPGRAGKILLVCAVSSACTAVVLGTRHPAPSDTSPISLRERQGDDRPAAPPATAATAVPAASAPPALAALPRQPAANPAAAANAPALRVATGTITHGFAATARQLGVDAGTTATLARALGSELNFRRDLKPGSQVRFVFGSPPIAPARQPEQSQAKPLAVRITTGQRSHDVYLYRNLQGKAFYYRKNGQSTAPAFSRYPLKFTRVSSAFSLRRLDPVTHRLAPHTGVDLAAPTGTPVHATADGTVKFVGTQTGYGKVIQLSNLAPYSTTFAHLSRFAKGLKRGERVRRGQVIGYVGSTGWATGPHLHYEVHVNHVAKNPLTVALPHDTPLRGAERKRFAQQTGKLRALL